MSRPDAALVRGLARVVTWIFYRVERVGHPPEGPVILLPNHPNALLDPAVVWATADRDVRFLAKAPLFRMPVISWFVRASGAIPVQRRSDEGADMARNAEMFAAAEAALARESAVCIFPEGASHSSGRLEPLRSGAARLALRAARTGTPVQLVTVGLNFDRKTAFRSRAVVVYGKPFGVEAVANAGEGDSPAAVRALTDEIAARLRRLVIEADPLTDAQLVARVDRLYCAARPDARHADRVQRRRLIAAGIERLRSERPEWYGALRQRLDAYGARLKRFGLRERDVDAHAPAAAALRFAVREGLHAIALAPLALGAFMMFFGPYHATGWLAAAAVRDLDVRATVQVIGGTVIYALWTLGLIGVLWWLQGSRAAIAGLLLLPVVALLGLFAFEREAAVWRTVRAYFAVRRASSRAHRRLRAHRAEIAEVLEQVYEWMKAAEPKYPKEPMEPRDTASPPASKTRR
jgi:1-acyl-sn-glycerol-3-phosphate acyltransferase